MPLSRGPRPEAEELGWEAPVEVSEEEAARIEAEIAAARAESAARRRGGGA
ncbi:hypothetical protein ABII15_23940 [Streptomyces sp. HUAS MG91]|uniref:Uncharacterized protein n=1 Tax=Streptomyces tabacisoli TaxID=3156398 RepID=A0AAU8IYH1_9ACTN